ncbi:MCE family protein [Leptospira noumeaensis]|uniref:MCE family protein n=1 Tax=Leptospira noumeaensis TaxID=2484964 RepID=A0A4R9I7F2_9LEPT|nr:MlaD family protein [Leptospira noumeaensis]TGK82062.1 MCE family protein [Leptospira noumeaensis]
MKPKKLSKESLTGIIFFSILVFAFFATVVETDRPAKKNPYRLSLFYSRVDGIKEGTEVRILGVPKGYVAHIDSRPLIDVPDRRFLDHNMDHAIELHIALEDPLTLWDNYEVDFQTVTLFSGRIININPGSSDGKRSFFKPTFRDGEKTPDYLPSARYFDDFFKATSVTMEENRADLRQITLDFRSISDKLNHTEGTIPKLIGSTEMYDELLATVKDAETIGKEGRRYMESSRNLENTMPIPFLITASYYGRTTPITGRRIGPQE